MRIRVGKKRLFLCLWLPLSFLKSKFALWLIRQAVDDETPAGTRVPTASIADGETAGLSDAAVDCQGNDRLEADVGFPTREQLTALYRALRSTVKICGHFDLVRVCSSDGIVVRIRI